MLHDRDTVWTTANGRGIAIGEMDLGHLVNVINWIIDSKNVYSQEIEDAMIAEANYRKLLLFAEGKPYPQKMGKRWKIIDPVTGEGKIEKPPEDYIEAVKDNPLYQKMRKKVSDIRSNKEN